MSKNPRPKQVKEIAESVGGAADGYSGRSMYGAECWSISCDDGAAVIEQAALMGVSRPLVDTLGRDGFVCYWPGCVYVEEGTP